MYKIYGKDSCRYCKLAQELLLSQQETFEYIDLSLDSNLLESFKSQGFRTVPVIYFGSELVGGYEDLQNHLLEKLM